MRNSQFITSSDLLFGKSKGFGKLSRCSDSDMMTGAVLDDDDEDDDDVPVTSNGIQPVLIRLIRSIFSTRGLTMFLLLSELGGSLVNCWG